MLLGANLLFTEKKGGLPYDAEIEYLESVEALKAGSQITFPVGDKATFECKLHIFDTRDLKFMGLMYNEGGTYQGCFQISTMSGGYRTQAPFMGVLSVDTPPVDITRPIVYKSPDPNHLYWTIDGVQYPVNACRWNTAGNFHLFHAGALNLASDKGRNRLYWCKVYEDGVLTHDLIPVRKGSVGYMYDRVSGQLYGNVGSGAFILGPDKVAKPYDAEVEYLEGDGTAYVVVDETNYSNNDYVRRTEFSVPTSLVSAFFVYGWFTTRRACHYIQVSSDGILQAYYVTARPLVSETALTLGHDHKVLFVHGTNYSSSELYQDGEQIGLTYKTSSKTYEGPVVFFAQTNSATDTTISMVYDDLRLYSFRLESNEGDVVYDLIPVRKDGVGYMYDKVSGQLFGNSAGEGALIIGPDK